MPIVLHINLYFTATNLQLRQTETTKYRIWKRQNTYKVTKSQVTFSFKVSLHNCYNNTNI